MTPQERTLALTRKAAALGSHPYHHHHQHQHRGGRRPITPPQQQQQHQQHRRIMELERPLAPPLPLVLRPPLRKKKSFSGRRVSRWLFPAPAGGEEVQVQGVGGSVTNAPRPVRGGEGFYQSFSSSSTSSSEVGEEEEEKGGVEESSGWETESGEGSGSGETTPRAAGRTTMGGWKGEARGGSPVGGGRRVPGQRGSVGVAF